MSMSRRRFLWGTVLTSVSAALTACGESPSGSEGKAKGDGQTLGSASAPVTEATIASPDSTFDVTTVHVPVGRPVQFTYDNRHEGVPHNLHVKGNGLDELTPVRAGKIVQKLTVTFSEPGSYDYICDVHPTTMRGVVLAA